MTGSHADKPARDRQVVASYLAGRSPRDIAVAVGLSTQRIYAILAKRNCPLRSRAAMERNGTIAAAYVAGESTVSIAERFNISRQRVEQIARAHGLPRRHPQKSPRRVKLCAACGLERCAHGITEFVGAI